MTGRSIRANPGFLFAALSLLGFVAGCDSKSAANGNGLATVRMPVGSETFTLEVADTDALRQKGLMRRDSMAKDRGMIFVFPDEAERSFWMKNTRIPLDIIFIDGNGVVVGIKQMKPYDLNPTNSPKPYRWAVELNKGAADEAGVKVGDQLTIPEAAKKVSE